VKIQALALVALLVVACNRQSSPQRNGTASEPSQAAGTAGVAERAVPAAPAPAGADAVERDASAIAALERMGGYLRGLTTFQIRGETSRDEVLEDGQNVAFDAVVDMIVQRPNRIRAEVTSDRKDRLYFGDGKTFSVWARRMNYYATIPAPATLRELADTLADKYDLELPLVDLFYWGERKSLDDIRGASDIGASQVGGVTCEHYAFRQEGADWQVWIQQGDYPLPRKLVIRTTTDPARPQYTATLAWNLAPSYDDTAFTFVPPKDAKRITLVEARAAATH
jgi:hypothetical protein